MISLAGEEAGEGERQSFPGSLLGPCLHKSLGRGIYAASPCIAMNASQI